MNPEQILSHLKRLTKSLSAGQIAGLVAVFLGVVGVVVGSAYYLSTPEFTLLVADMDPETATSVVSKLKDQRVQYQLTDGGRSVRVPVDKVDELRLELAGGGLPSAGRIGFEIFDRPAFGTTDFSEQVNYRRALEGELARTISTLSEVSSARVHIALGKESLFVDQTEAAKASVVLHLKNNRPLAPATTRAIAGLVAGSVENLRPEAVVIVDTFGRPLTRPDENEDTVGRSAVERQQQIERDLSTRVVALLEPVVGAGRVRVNVSAQLQNSRIEQTEERYDPNTVVRSRQTSTETGSSAVSSGGIAGARANQPPALSTAKPGAAASNANAAAATAGTTPADAAATTATPAATPAPAPMLPPGVPGRATETTNYEVGRVTRHTISPQGDLARLSVAVILDDERVTTKAQDGTATVTTKAWAPDQLTRFQNLVSAAVGLDTERGDILTVENVAFEAPVQDVVETAPGVGQQVMQILKEYWPAALRGIAIVGLASFALFGVLRPMAKSASAAVRAQPQIAAAPAGGAARLATVSEMEERIEAELDADDGERSRKLPVLTRRVAKLASDEPEQLARIVRGWMAEEDR